MLATGLATIVGKRSIPVSPWTCWAKTTTAESSGIARKAIITNHVSMTSCRRPSDATGAATGAGVASAAQNGHPAGGGGHSGGGIQPLGGRQPGGAGGQFGGDRHCQPSLAVMRGNGRGDGR